MTGSDRWDAIVVGARIAGAATALRLARQGLRVLVLERGHHGADTLSTHALMRGGAAMLQSLGLLDRVAAAGTPAVRQTRFHYPGETRTVSIRPAAGVDALYAPRRTLLDAMMIDAAAAAGAEVRFGFTVSDLTRDSAGRVTGVVGHTPAGEPVRVQAWLTIGADGRHSVVARRSGARVTRLGHGVGAVAYGYWSGIDVTGYEWFYRPGSTAGMIPTNDGEVCVFAGLPASRFGAEFTGDRLGAYLRLLKEATGGDDRLDAARRPARVRAFPGRPGYLREATGPGWALVGDAGGFLDPLSTHGMTDALRDATLLARAIAAVRHGEAEATAMAGYGQLRDTLVGPIFATVDQICAYGWDNAVIQRLLIELSSSMSDEIEAIQRSDGYA
jgi:flavin-dependent dehydrogenase